MYCYSILALLFWVGAPLYFNAYWKNHQDYSKKICRGHLVHVKLLPATIEDGLKAEAIKLSNNKYDICTR